MFDPPSAPPSEIGPALQDRLRVHCFGCGALNERGLRIKSHRVRGGEGLVCRWQPEPHLIGYPGVLYGGTIASVVDCHAVWTALDHHCRRLGLEPGRDRLDFAFVTGKLSISYLKQVEVMHPIELHARVTETGKRTATVECRVLQHGQTCATAEVVAVRVKAQA